MRKKLAYSMNILPKNWEMQLWNMKTQNIFQHVRATTESYDCNILTLQAPTLQNGQTHSNNSPAVAE